MAEQERKQKPAAEQETDETTVEPKIGLQANHDAKIAKIDEVLDGIDEVLEANAEDFVRSYVQKGGQ